jgi:hypothetical protein
MIDTSFAMTMGILSAALGKASRMPNNTYCPTSDCSLDDFTTLAVCSTCESASLDDYSDKCSYTLTGPFQYLDDFEEGETERNTELNLTMLALLHKGRHVSFRNKYADFERMVDEVEEGSVWDKVCPLGLDRVRDPAGTLQFTITPQHWIPDSYPWRAEGTNSTKQLAELPWLHRLNVTFSSYNDDLPVYVIGNTAASSTAVFLKDQPKAGYTAPVPTLSACSMGWPRERNNATPNIFGSVCATAAIRPPTLSKPDYFGQTNATVTKCRLDLCARRYQNASMGPDGFQAMKSVDSPLTASLKNDTASIYSARDKSNNNYQYDRESLETLRLLAQSVMDTPNFENLLTKNLPNSTTDWVQFFDHMAEVFTQVVQSPYNPRAKRLAMPAYGSEVFVRVRWVWFIMPLSLVVASNIILFLMIHRSGKKPFLYKNSILATLFHGLDGWEMHELVSATATGRETFNDMLDTSRGMVASLKKDEDGYLKLKRE